MIELHPRTRRNSVFPCAAPCRAVQLEPVDGGTCGEGRGGLQREHAQRLSWSPREPFQREVRHYWYLSRHEKLPEMSRGSLVGFVHDAEYRNVNQHQSQGGSGHCEWKQGARLLHRWDVISTSAASEPKRAALDKI